MTASLSGKKLLVVEDKQINTRTFVDQVCALLPRNAP
jgi:hypothetical protein